MATTKFRLGARGQAKARELSMALRVATDEAVLLPHIEALLVALRAEGLPLSPGAIDAQRGQTTTAEQALMNQIDISLSHLDGAPMLVDLEGSRGCSRRTLTRSIRGLHQRYNLRGGSNGNWRDLRDSYRLTMASILLSEGAATPRGVAGLVGYGSVEALDHAFRSASLPPPAAFRRLVLAA